MYKRARQLNSIQRNGKEKKENCGVQMKQKREFFVLFIFFHVCKRYSTTTHYSTEQIDTHV